MSNFNPEMLVRARESRRMTQAELARRSGTAQGSISKAENGQTRPSDDLLAAWAKGLGYPRSLLERQAGAPPLPVTFFRKRASLAATAAKAITANIALRTEHIDTLARSVELPSPALSPLAPHESGMSPARIAQELRVAWRLAPGPIENLTTVLEDAGIIVVAIDFGVDRIDGLSVWERPRGVPPIMFVNSRSPMDRVRFTMAHELGHLVMHMHQVLPPATCEDEADEFASEFLMPRADIAAQLNHINIERLAQLKQHWGVSMQSLLVRARSLQRISEHQSTRLWRQLSALGYRLREPVEVEREQAGLVGELVRVHLEDLGYSEEQLAAAVDMELEEFRENYLGVRPGLRLVR